MKQSLSLAVFCRVSRAASDKMPAEQAPFGMLVICRHLITDVTPYVIANKVKQSLSLILFYKVSHAAS